MTDVTRFKDLQESHKNLEKLFQTENLKREAAEGMLIDNMKELATKMEEKFDNVTKTLTLLQLQLSNHDNGKGQSSGGSILGSPNQGSSGAGPLHQFHDTSR